MKDEFLVSKDGNDTMWISKLKEKKVNYVLIKIGDKFYSTTFGGEANCKTTIAKATTKNLTPEKTLRVTGVLTETNKHTKLENPEPFEVTLYFEDEKCQSQ